MQDEGHDITPSTKVATLLDRYPQLEEILIEMAPPFKKLRNPVLRKTVAKVASLRQAAAVGRMSVEVLVNRLRAAVGQEALALGADGEKDDYFTSQPDWFDRTKVVASIDEQADVHPDEMPLTGVLQAATALQQNQIVELITTYLPAPGIDIMRKKGFLVWSMQEAPELVRTFFSKPANPAGGRRR